MQNSKSAKSPAVFFPSQGLWLQRGWSALKLSLPWLVSGLLLYWVFSQHDLYAVFNAFEHAQVFSFLLVTVGYLLGTLVVDSIYLHMSFGYLATSGTFMEMLRVRAAAYVLTIINMFVGMGGLVVYMHRRHGIGLKRGSGIMLVELLQEVGAMSLVVLLASLFLIEPSSPHIPQAIAAAYWLLGFYVLCYLVSRVSRYLSPNSKRQDVFRTFDDLQSVQFIKLLGIKILQNLLHGAYIVFALLSFGINVPRESAMAFAQVIQLARNMPLNAFGIGVDQLTFATLFSVFESVPGQVVAFSIAYTFSVLLGRALLGFIYLPHAMKILGEQKNA
ncbi:MAG: lysylphosphatidylglycerol synthase domain-containing protein [Myxococcota bacterium]|jgi:uncharacterized membrane protein YbhN (UPF0104 family)|nr:lysylphosphatidylglycerol synthase domain-containing protein [Myxococcota bacterium]